MSVVQRVIIPVAVLGVSINLLMAGPSFVLEEVKTIFPYENLKERIEFWKLVFTQWGEKDVIFHDEDDLCLVYHIETFDREPENDPADIRRRRNHLRRKLRQTQALFDQIIRYGPDSQRLTREQRKIVECLRNGEYDLNAGTLNRLKNKIRYQRGIKEKFRESLIRSGMYLEHMQSIFARYGLPKELAYLPHVESSFDYDAYSKAGAAGIWQFTRGTGRFYLRINRYVDERRDPICSTDAAARLLRDNYEALGTWPLTITSYNHGKNGMLRAKRLHGTELSRILKHYKSPYFGFASQNFYAEFLAALVVAKNHEEYFGPLEFAPPLQFETLQLENAYSYSYFTTVPGLTRKTLSAYNPHLRNLFSSPGSVLPSGVEVRVPVGMKEPLSTTLQSAKPASSGVILAANGSTLYRVQPGDVLGQIASDFGTSVQKLKQLNRLANINRIQVGQVLVISPPSEVSNTTVSRESPPSAGGGTRRHYIVRRGDTLAKIARQFGTSVALIREMNRISDSNLIRAGQKLVIP